MVLQPRAIALLLPIFVGGLCKVYNCQSVSMRNEIKFAYLSRNIPNISSICVQSLKAACFRSTESEVSIRRENQMRVSYILRHVLWLLQSHRQCLDRCLRHDVLHPDQAHHPHQRHGCQQW